MNGSRRCSLMGICVVGLLLSQSGCNLYMHDKGRSESAKSAKTAFEDFAKKSPDRYDVMVKNLQRIAVEEDALISDLAVHADETRVTLTPTMPFSDLLADIQKLTGDPDSQPPKPGEIVTFQREQYKAIKEVLDVTQAHKDSIADTTVAVKAAQDRVNAAKDDLTRWNKVQAVLLTAIESLPDFRKATDGKPLGDTLGAAAATIGEKELKYTDADGAEKTEKLKKILIDLGKGAAAGVEKEGLKDFIKAPGADLVILNLALELTKIHQRRAKLVVERDQALVVSAHDGYMAAEISRQLLAESFNQLVLLDSKHSTKDGSGKSTRDTTPLKIIAASRAVIARAGAGAGEVDDARANVASLLSSLRQAAVARAMAIRTIRTFEVNVARVAHGHSIADSALNNEEWRAVIASGIEGLDQYYESGVRPEDVANYISLGQAIAAGVIAAKVD